MTPYVACMLVVVGLLAHFLIILVRFLNRQDAALAAAAAEPRIHAVYQDWALAGCGPVCRGVLDRDNGLCASPRPDAMNLDRFGRLPVKFEGHIKPFETLARNILRLISGKETFTLRGEKIETASPGQGTPRSRRSPKPRTRRSTPRKPTPSPAPSKTPRQKPARASPRFAGCWTWPAIVTPRSTAASFVSIIQRRCYSGSRERPDPRYAVAEFRDKFPALLKEIAAIHKVPTEQLSACQQQLLDLFKKLQTYQDLAAFEQPDIRDNEHLWQSLMHVKETKDSQIPLAVPPHKADEPWQPLFTEPAAQPRDRARGVQAKPRQSIFGSYRFVVRRLPAPRIQKFGRGQSSVDTRRLSAA